MKIQLIIIGVLAAVAITIGAIVLVKNDQREAEKQAQANREIKEEMQRQAEEASEKMRGGSATAEDVSEMEAIALKAFSDGGGKDSKIKKEAKSEEKEE